MRIFTTVITLMLASTAFAQLSDGFYRVKNNYTKRYLYVLDNKGKIDYTGFKADVSAITPYQGEDKAMSDPATIIYFETIEGGYRFKAQGTSSYDIAAGPVRLDEGNGTTKGAKGTYRCSASQKGATLFLIDDELDPEEDKGILKTANSSNFEYENNKTKSGACNANWYVMPINTTDNYFGVAPTINVNGKYYTTFYASFAFKPLSSDMKVYVITKNDNERTAWEEVTGTIPASTPVIIECGSSNPADNKVEVLANGGTLKTDNLLKGVYFNNPGIRSNQYLNKNQTAYDAATMRVLGITSDGSLGLVKSNKQFIDANTAYFYTAEAVNDELAIMDTEEYDAIVPIEAAHRNADNNVYNMQGMKVRQGSTTTQGLPTGIYIIEGKKVVVR